ncbi:MAG: WD40 repeat domain-containing protein [Verrucomicrobiota bacterium]
MKPKILLCLALVLSVGLLGCSTGGTLRKDVGGLLPGPSLDQHASFNGKQLIVGDTVWDVQTGKKLQQFPVQPISVYAATLGPDGRRVLTEMINEASIFSEREPARLWDIASGREIRRFDLSVDVEFSPDGNRILGTDAGNHVRMWDGATGQLLWMVQGLFNPGGSSLPLAYAASFSPDGRRLAVLSFRKITVLDSTTGKELCAIKQGDAEKFFNSVQYGPNGKVIVTDQINGVVKIWDATTGQNVRVFSLATNSPQYWAYALFTPNGQEVLSASENGLAVLWDAKSGKEIRRFQMGGTDRMLSHQMILSSDGKRLITQCKTARTGGGGPDQIEALWDLESGRLIRQFDEYGRVVGGYARGYEKIVGFSPVGETFITIMEGEPAALYDGATGEIIRRYSSN